MQTERRRITACLPSINLPRNDGPLMFEPRSSLSRASIDRKEKYDEYMNIEFSKKIEPMRDFEIPLPMPVSLNKLMQGDVPELLGEISDKGVTEGIPDDDEDLSYYDNIGSEDILLIKEKFIEAKDNMFTLYPTFTPTFTIEDDIKTMHKKYNKGRDSICIYENMREIKIIMTLLSIIFEGLLGKYITIVSFDGLFDYIRQFKDSIDEYIRKYCTDSYMFTKKENLQKPPEKIVFYKDDKLISIDIDIGRTLKKKEELSKPNISSLIFTLLKTAAVFLAGFIINNQAKNWLDKDIIDPDIAINWVNEYVKTWTTMDKRYDDTAVETIDFFIPRISKRMTTEVMGIDLLDKLENYNKLIKGLMFRKGTVEEPQPVAVKNRTRTPRKGR